MSHTAPPPPKTPKSAATRQLLLDVAHRLFIDAGYEAVSMNDIASAAGVTKGAIYGHFRSKGQLLVEVIRAELAAGDREFDERDGASRSTIDLFFAEATAELRLLQVDAAAAARHDDDVRAGLAELNEERRRWIADLTRSSFEAAGVECPVDADAFAFVVAALAGGVGMQEASGASLPDRAVVSAVIDDMLSGAMTGGRP